MRTLPSLLLLLSFAAPLAAADRKPLPEFERVVIDDDMPGGYQVEVADVNGDGKPDVVGLSHNFLAWYENPGWKKHVICTKEQTPELISSATADLDGDGKAEVVVAYDFAMNQPARGKLALATQGEGGKWTIKPIADVPSIHRLRLADFDGDKRPELVVAPIFGPAATAANYAADPARLEVYSLGKKPTDGDWTALVVARRPVLHAIAVQDVNGTGRPDILTADNLGVTFVAESPDAPGTWAENILIPGAAGEPPKRGSSEVHLGKLADGRRFLATIDPWHGSEVAVCVTDGPMSLTFGPRTVIDDTLDVGHALWVADVDGDGDDEVFAGHRGKDGRVSAYDFDGKTWKRTVLDPDITAQDLRGGDLDGDGTPDVVAIGGSTHNLVWYRPR